MHRNLVAVFGFVLVGSSMVELASGKNILTGIRESLKTDGTKKTDKPIATDFDDAATGTVQGDMAAKQQASTCDGQLAAALVQANDLATSTQKELDEEVVKHKGALETIVGLQRDLRETSTKLAAEEQALYELKNEMAESLFAEKNRSKEELEALKDQAEKDLEALRNDKDNIISTLKEESAALLESIKKSSDKKVEDLEAQKDETIAVLTAQLEMSSQELETMMRNELEKAKREKEMKVAEIAADRDATVDKLTQSMAEAAANAAQVLQTTQEAAKRSLESVEADRDLKLKLLTQEMEEAAREAAKVLQTTKDKAEAALSKQMGIAKKEADDAAADYEGTISKKNVDIKAMQENAEKMMAKLQAVERNLEEANMELSHWRELHDQQNYCNVTLIANDVFDASAVAYKHAAEIASEVYTESVRIASSHVSDGLEYSNRFFNEKVEEHWPSIQPLYDEHITSNYQNHIEPHLQKHVYPKLEQASSWSNAVAKPTVLQAIDDGKKSYDTQLVPIVQQNYQVVVHLYETYCKYSFNEFLKAGQELQILRENPPPAFILESWQTSCENPRDSLSALMHGSLVLMLVIFHRRLIALVWGIVKFFLSLVVRFTPLRFVVPRRSTTKSVASPPSSPTPLVTEASSDSLMKSQDEGETGEMEDAAEANSF